MPAREKLAGAIGKIERAEEQVRNLNSEAAAYFSKPTGHKIIGHREDENSLSAMVGVRGPTLPIRFSILIGEIAHHLRSSLDHLAWQLVLANNREPSRSTEFPVFDDRIDYEAKAIRKIEGMSDEAKAFVQGYQPYQSMRGYPHQDPIWIIHEMDRIDKHRLLLGANTQASYTSRFLEKAFSDGKTSIEYEVKPPHEVDVDHDPVLSITLTDIVDEKPVIPLLSQCIDWTKRVLDDAANDFFSDLQDSPSSPEGGKETM